MSENANIIEKIVAAVSGRPDRRDPTLKSACIIAQEALPKIKKLAGYSKWLNCEKEIRRLWREQNFELTPLAAEQAYAKQHEDHVKLATQGASLRQVERGRSLEAWRDDFAARARASEDAMRALAQELKPLREEVTAAIVDTLNETTADVMLAESKLAAKYGIVYQTSPTVNALRDLQNYLTNRGTIVLFELLG